MATMTVLELIQCLLWAALIVGPLLFSFLFYKETDETVGTIWGVLTIFTQIGAMICAYKAGGK